MDQFAYRRLISGEKRGLVCFTARLLLRLLSFFYCFVVWFRNFCYDMKIFRSHAVSAQVISIGNLTTGGTGKTPFVIWVCKYLAEKGIKCSVLTRGYKTQRGKFSDEPAILAKSCEGAHILVDSNRVNSAKKALREYNSKVLLMDDGFQHRRLARNLDIVTIDATCPFGYGHLLPAGLLRESIKSLKRAHAVLITRTDQVDPLTVQAIEKQVKQANPTIVIAKSVHHNPYAKVIKGEMISLDDLAKKNVFVFCGLGNPSAFLNKLHEYNLTLVGSKIYNDHYDYSPVDIEEIVNDARSVNADIILSTQKDWVKTALNFREENILFAYLAVEIDIQENCDKIESLICETLGLIKHD